MQHLEDKNSDLSTDGAVGVARDFLVRLFLHFPQIQNLLLEKCHMFGHPSDKELARLHC